jgi:hypothetical protein
MKVKIKVGAIVHQRMQAWKWPNVGNNKDSQIEFDVIGKEDSTGMLHLVADGFGADTRAGSMSVFANEDDCIYGESASEQN